MSGAGVQVPRTPLQTPAAVLEAFSAALEALQPELVKAPGVWPAGPRLRFQVPSAPSWSRTGPAVATPTTLVWYHRTGDWRGLLQGVKVAAALGLPLEEAIALGTAEDVRGVYLRAGDPGPWGMTAPKWRAGLIEAVERYVSRADFRPQGKEVSAGVDGTWNKPL